MLQTITATHPRTITDLLDELVEATEPGVEGFIKAFRMLSSGDFLNSLPEPYLDALCDSEDGGTAFIESWVCYLRDQKRRQEFATILSERRHSSSRFPSSQP